MTREDWIEDGRLHAAKVERNNWELAWWLVAGRQWDENFKLSAQVTGYSESHLFNLYRVGAAFPKGRAHPDLSLSAHRELLREPNETDRTLLFARAIEERWTQGDVVAYFERKAPSPRPESDHPKAVASRKYYAGVHVQCPDCAAIFPVKGHKHAPVAREDSDPVQRAAAGEGTLPGGEAEPVLAAPGVGGDPPAVDS